MTTGMKGDNIGYFCPSCRQHSHRRYACMASLAMNKVPCTVFDQGKDPWRDIIIATRRPCFHANDAHSLVFDLSGELVIQLLWFGCQQCHTDSLAHQASSDFMHMRLDPPHMRKIAGGYH